MYLRLSNDCVIPKNEIIGIFDMDNTVGDLSEMPCGCYAERESIRDYWIIK